MQIHIKKRYIRKYGMALSGMILILAAVLIIFTVWVSEATAEDNIVRRVNSESEFLARQQAELINEVIEEQYRKVATIADMIENGLSFYEEKNQAILNSFVEKNQICMLGYADADGEVISYKGEYLGNISNRTYFSQLMTKNKESSCEYLDKTKRENEPRVIFSAAVCKEQKPIGIVSFSKEVDLLRESLFQQSMFEDNECSIIVDRTGKILVKNERAGEKYAAAHNVNDIYHDAGKYFGNLKSAQSGSVLVGEQYEDVFSYASVGQNDWYLICLIDTDIARHEYAENLMAIRRSIILLATIFILTIGYFFILVIIRLRNSSKAYKDYKNQYERVLSLLQKMKCMIWEYDVRTRKIKTNSSFKETFGMGEEDDFRKWIEDNKKAHSEFDYKGLIRELNRAIKYKITTSVDTIYCMDESVYKMLSVVMMPLIQENGQVMNVFGSVRETSEEHLQLKEMVDLFNQIPGGTYRCHLSDLACLEYAGEKLCEMVGFNEEEFHQIIGHNYTQVIMEEDRSKYEAFLKEAAASPGVRSCQYRMCYKEGTTLSVLDTMESIRNDSGEMYGYSVVVDISEYVKRQNIVRQELKQMEISLKEMRIRNSASQMQPHFLYNALSSIREVVLLDQQYASDLLYDFTVYLRACIKTMQNGALIPMHQEMDNIRAYVNIEKMRMGNRLHVIYDMQSEDFMIVPLSIQPLVENAIRHGIYQRGRQGGNVSIKTETFLNYHLITVKDDGVGFDYQKVRDEVEKGIRNSIGLDNVIFRLGNQLQADIVIKSEIGVGTVINISVPRERKNHESDNS